MIREIAAALGGVFSGLAAFLVVLFYQGVANTPNTMSTGFRTLQPIAGPTNASASLRFYSGASGFYSGILPGLLLMLIALGTGILVAYVGVGRLKGDERS